MKKKMTFSKLLMLVIITILPLSMFAQNGKDKKTFEKYWYISGEGGLAFYHGDIADYTGIATPKNSDFFWKEYNGKLGLGYQFSKSVGFNIKVGLGTLEGKKNYGQDIRSHYLVSEDPYNNSNATRYGDKLTMGKTTYIEPNFNLTFNLFNMFFGYNPDRVFSLIPHVGIGGLFYKTGQIQKEDPLSNTSGTTGLSELVPASQKFEPTWAVPVGAEINFRLGKKVDLFFDYTYSFAGNDNIDRVIKADSWQNGDGSYSYKPEGQLNNGKRALRIYSDMFSNLNLGLRYKFISTCDIDKMARDAKNINYKVNPDPLVADENGKVCFDVITKIPGEYFEKDAVMNLTPYLAYNGGQLTLDPITFVGQKVKSDGDFRVNYKEGGEFTKHYCIDYVPEIENSELMGDPMFYVYNGTIYPTQDEIVKNVYFTQGGERKLADGVIVTSKPIICEEPTSINVTSVNNNTITVSWNGNASAYDLYVTTGGKPNVDSTPTVAGLKETSYTISDLDPGKYYIYVRSNCNQEVSGWEGTANEVSEWESTSTVISEVPAFIYYFAKDESVIKNIQSNKAARKALADLKASGKEFKGFRIEAWASPEGELDHNRHLADDRGDAAEKDIKAQLKKDAKKYEYNAKGNGPDWDTFMKLVENSNLADKNAILNNIRKSSNREQAIKEMISIYPQLEEEILPLIRRAEVYITK